MKNHFANLGVEERYDLDDEQLQRRFRERSREVHPDRFARAAAGERLRALEAQAAVNEAMKVLSDPLARAEHLLALRGLEVSERDPVPQDFLLEILELREALDDAKQTSDEARVAEMEADMRARRDAALRRIGAGFAGGGDLEAIRQELTSLRYFRRFLDEAEGVEAA
jgi:molecular chaperone HscB